MGGPCDKVAEHGGYGWDEGLSFGADMRERERQRAEKWKRLAHDALLVLQAFAVGNATQAAIDAALDEEDKPNVTEHRT
jgi:hypothetical protein